MMDSPDVKSDSGGSRSSTAAPGAMMGTARSSQYTSPGSRTSNAPVTRRLDHPPPHFFGDVVDHVAHLDVQHGCPADVDGSFDHDRPVFVRNFGAWRPALDVVDVLVEVRNQVEETTGVGDVLFWGKAVEIPEMSSRLHEPGLADDHIGHVIVAGCVDHGIRLMEFGPFQGQPRRVDVKRRPRLGEHVQPMLDPSLFERAQIDGRGGDRHQRHYDGHGGTRKEARIAAGPPQDIACEVQLALISIVCPRR